MFSYNDMVTAFTENKLLSCQKMNKLAGNDMYFRQNKAVLEYGNYVGTKKYGDDYYTGQDIMLSNPAYFLLVMGIGKDTPNIHYAIKTAIAVSSSTPFAINYDATLNNIYVQRQHLALHVNRRQFRVYNLMNQENFVYGWIALESPV